MPKQEDYLHMTPSLTKPLIAIVCVVVVLFAAFALLSHPSHPGLSPHSLVGRPVPYSTVEQELSSLSHRMIGLTGGTAAKPLKGQKIWRTDGRLTVFYLGAEYCPFCAAERWPLLLALDRFGSFHGLTYMQSSSTDVFPGTSTFSFAKATYSSPYVKFLPVETYTNVEIGGTYPTLQHPDQQELNIYHSIDPSGSIPFVDVGNRYAWIGSGYSPSTLAGLSWSQIISDIRSGNSIGKIIYANANRITAAICSLDGGKPRNVC